MCQIFLRFFKHRNVLYFDRLMNNYLYLSQSLSVKFFPRASVKLKKFTICESLNRYLHFFNFFAEPFPCITDLFGRFAYVAIELVKDRFYGFFVQCTFLR